MQDNSTINYRKDIYPLFSLEERHKLSHVFNKIPLIPVDHEIADDYRMVPIYDRKELIDYIRSRKAKTRSDSLRDLFEKILGEIDD